MEMFNFKNKKEKMIDFDNYLVLNSKNLEENAYKVLRFDHLEGIIEGENYILSKGIIVNNKHYALYDFNGNKISMDYKYAYPLLNDNMFYVTDKVKEGNESSKMVQTYGIVDNNGEEVFEVEDIFDSIVPIARHTVSNEMNEENCDFEKIYENGKVGFKDSSRIVIAPLYDYGYCKDDKFIMQDSSRIYIFDKKGNNVILNEKINKICNNIIKGLKLNIGADYKDLELFYNLHFLIDILDKNYYLYDLENDRLVSANELFSYNKSDKKSSFVRKRK